MYKVLSHTADVGLEMEAATLEELFIEAVKGWKHIILEGSETSPRGKRSIYLISNSLEDLMVQWLGELNYFLSVHYQIIHEVTKLNIKNEDSQWKLRAEITEEAARPEVHSFNLEIKAVTYHQLNIEKVDNLYRTRIIFDI